MKVEVSPTAFAPYEVLQQYQRDELGATGSYGATTVFVGTMRDFNEGETVKAMRLDYYPGMTEQHLQGIAETALDRWDVLDVLLVHRVGDILPGEPIVLVAVWSAHRAAAFEACRFVIEDLKARAPFWKKESLETRERWVATNTPA